MENALKAAMPLDAQRQAEAAPKFRTMKEMCEIYRCCPQTIYNRMADGSVPSIKFGRKRLFPASGAA